MPVVFMKGGTKPRKYRNEPVELDGLSFDSKAEARRWCELQILQRAGKIEALELHPRYRLEVDGFLICTLVADFRYRVIKTGKIVVEDVKGGKVTQTREFRIKKRLLWALYHIDIAVLET